MHKKLKILICCIILFFNWDQVQACMGIPEPYETGLRFKDEIIDHADVVFRGRLVSLEPLSGLMIKAKLKFKVVETYRGVEASSWVAIWVTDTFPIKWSMDLNKIGFEEDLVVALVKVEKKGIRVSATGVDLDVLDSMDRDLQKLPWVLRRVSCEPPVMGSFEVMEPLLKRRNIIK